MKNHQSFTPEFKREAVRLMDHSGRPAAEIALELGIRRNQLYKWKAQLERAGDKAFPGSGAKPLDEQAEVARLRRELARVTEERDILKKAAAYFAKRLP
ncbi:MAG: transposase [Luteibacter sp.]